MEDVSLESAINNERMYKDTNEKLSLCMIVKDEAGMLPEFLARELGPWDELVVVDTGSQEDTVAILKAAGAKVVRDPDDWSADSGLESCAQLV
jgi:hypothetical protein